MIYDIWNFQIVFLLDIRMQHEEEKRKEKTFHVINYFISKFMTESGSSLVASFLLSMFG